MNHYYPIVIIRGQDLLDRGPLRMIKGTRKMYGWLKGLVILLWPWRAFMREPDTLEKWL